ncbi:MAG: DUF3276 family protein [candidate division WOR-3 bacterium]|jgi:hypothetical protein
MEAKRHQNNIIWSKKVKTDRRTYFFDIKTDSKGNNFISISESRKTPSGPKKQMIVIYPENLEEFYKAFLEVKNNFK